VAGHPLCSASSNRFLVRVCILFVSVLVLFGIVNLS